MKTLSLLRKKASSPHCIGFLCASCLYFSIASFLLFGSRTQQILLKQEGSHSFTIALHSFQDQPQPPNPTQKQPTKQQKSKTSTPKLSALPKNQAQTMQKLPQEQKPASTPEMLKYNEGITHDFLLKIHSLISSYNPYPQMARRQRFEGEVVVEFVLDTSGVMSEVKIIRTTAKEILQKSALKALHKASNYFPLPPKKVKIRVSILYKLN